MFNDRPPMLKAARAADARPALGRAPANANGSTHAAAHNARAGVARNICACDAFARAIHPLTSAAVFLVVTIDEGGEAAPTSGAFNLAPSQTL